MNQDGFSLVLIDSHVHIYDCFDVARLLDSAYRNFTKEALRRGAADSVCCVLMLTEISRHHWYHSLAGSGGARYRDWRIEHADSGECALVARSKSEARILIVAGSQVISAEGLEILSLATDSRFEDGLAARTVLERIRSAGGIPVLPWGAGKWLGKRGKVISALVAEDDAGGLFLGDNSGRPGFWPEPEQFREAASAGIRILPGTDPLPIPGEEARVGSFGFAAYGEISSRPVEWLKQRIVSDGFDPDCYGSLEHAMRFFRNQLKIRIKRCD